ncbi:aromatic prenyltransferase [Streptomyces sp. SBT349]|uniref:aromatic prenyltransferase n=1 Tax=Streptomyces sp. SBT349 TaxID=1580539 RepID=UPI00066D9A2A|nr:aromatic prenyltransferase [Streptomyces sp. SBT349]
MTVPTTGYSQPRFLDDIRSTAAALGAPFDEDVTRDALSAFADEFGTGAVVWKTTSRPGDDLSYRFYSRSRTDTVATAMRAGLLPRATPLAPLIAHWSGLFGGAAEQSCDFTAGSGLDKTWVWLGGTRPASDVLDAGPVPDALRRNVPACERRGLAYIRFLAVDHRRSTVNVYFRVRGPLTHAQAADLVGLVRVPPPPRELVAEIGAFVPGDFGVSVTFSLRDGRAERVCFYALRIPRDRAPRLPDRITAFLSAAPSYDAEDCHVVGWSFGPGNGTYVKAERSCLGGMISLFERWDCHFSGSGQRDGALPAVASPVPRVRP